MDSFAIEEYLPKGPSSSSQIRLEAKQYYEEYYKNINCDKSTFLKQMKDITFNIIQNKSSNEKKSRYDDIRKQYNYQINHSISQEPVNSVSVAFNTHQNNTGNSEEKIEQNESIPNNPNLSTKSMNTINIECNEVLSSHQILERKLPNFDARDETSKSYLDQPKTHKLKENILEPENVIFAFIFFVKLLLFIYV